MGILRILRHYGAEGYQDYAAYTRLNDITKILQSWLRPIVKRYIQYKLSVWSLSNSSKNLNTLKVFSAFLFEKHSLAEAKDINRSMIIDYLSYLRTRPIQNETRRQMIICLRGFLTTCHREGWFPDIQPFLIYREDIPQHELPHPRFIPESVLAQLNQHLDGLPPNIMRMVLIIQECGMRISELCELSFDCLRQDADGDWWLSTYQRKMKKEHSIPVFPEVVAVIQEQQQIVLAKWGPGCPFLFPTKKRSTAGNPYPASYDHFRHALNMLAYEKNILGPDGTVFRFQSHQFRHTVGTRMINNGYPHHIIQRYLGHESPYMTERYVHLHDKTLKQEFEKFRGSEIDISGRITQVPDDTLVDKSDLQWLKKQIQAQSLPNGRCTLPIGAQACPNANACLTCVFFRTDARFLSVHQEQRRETEQIINHARANGWIRMEEMNVRVAENLDRIILSLEAQGDGT